MKIRISSFTASCFCIVILTSCTTPDEAANQLFVEASNLVVTADEASQGNFSAALEHYKKALAKVEKISSKYSSSQLAVQIAQGNAKLGDYTISELRDEIIPRTENKALAEKSPLACAFLIALSIDDLNSKIETLIRVAESSLKFEQYEFAIRVLDSLLVSATGYDDNFIGQTIAMKTFACIKTNQYEKALAAAKSIKGDYHDNDKIRAFTMIAHKFMEIGKENRCLEAAAETGNSVEKTKTLTASAKQFREKGDRKKALIMLSHAEEAVSTIVDKEQKIEALLYITDEYLEAKDEHYALVMLSHAMQTASNVDDPSQKIRVLGTIARKYSSADQKSKALEILSNASTIAHEVRPKKERDEMLSDVISGFYSDIGEFDQAIKLANYAASVYEKEFVLSTIARDCAEAGSYDLALNIANGIKTKLWVRTKIHVFEVVAGKCAEAGEYDQALEAAGLISDPSVRIEALMKIASAYWKNGLDQKASEVATNAMRIAKNTESKLLEPRALSSIANQYVKAGLFDQAFQAIRLAKKPGQNVVEVLLSIADNYSEANQPEREMEVMSFAYQLVHSARAAEPVSWGKPALLPGLRLIVDKYARIGQFERALEIAESTSGTRDKAVLFARIATVYTEIGNKNKATELFNRAIGLTEATENAESKARLLTAISDDYIESNHQPENSTQRMLYTLAREF